MSEVNQRAYVGYSAAQMYALVNDIRAYPEFLPFCSSAQIIEQRGDTLTATVVVATGRIRQAFTTCNTMQLDRSISVALVEGPFRSLSGVWTFTDEAEGGCTMTCAMQFEFKSQIMKYTFGVIFERLAHSFMDIFVQRAHEVYGG